VAEPAPEKRLRDFLGPRHWHTWFGLALLWSIGRLPLRCTWLLGSALGELLHALHASRRRIARINISRCFPDLSPREYRRLTRAHFRALGQSVLDIGVAWWASERRLRRLVRWRGREYYDSAVKQGRHVVLLVPHVVGIEIGGVRLSIDLPIVDIFRHPDNELLALVTERSRRRFQARLVEHVRGLVPVIKQLNAGYPLYYLPDQDPGKRSSSFVPFFGIPAATFNVLGRIAGMTHAVVIPCHTRQLPFGAGYEIEFKAPLADYPTGDVTTDTTRMNQAIEECVRAAPAQYFWVHKRFKTRPEGEPNFYAR
jgi:Kdo2-lipid IVA lauroyltransferase/acyltransferase